MSTVIPATQIRQLHHAGELAAEVFRPRGFVTFTSTWDNNFFSVPTAVPTEGPVTVL